VASTRSIGPGGPFAQPRAPALHPLQLRDRRGAISTGCSAASASDMPSPSTECVVQLKLARRAPALAGVRKLVLDDPSASRPDSRCNFSAATTASVDTGGPLRACLTVTSTDQYPRWWSGE
jgi:hypothetical protein